MTLLNTAPQASVALDPVLLDCLERHGFEPTQHGTYSNGRATLRTDGFRLTVEPADRERLWHIDLRSQAAESIVGILDSLLRGPAFLSRTAWERRLKTAHRAKIALDRIAETIQDDPDSPGSRQLTDLLGSMFNQHHAVNLWSLRDALDAPRIAWVDEILQAYLQDLIPADLLRAGDSIIEASKV